MLILENRRYICHFLEGGKLRGLYCINVKNAYVFGEEVNIFFQYLNGNIIIINSFLSVEVFDFPKNIELFNSSERKGAFLNASCIAVMLACLLHFITDFNVGQDILLNYESMLLDSQRFSFLK